MKKLVSACASAAFLAAPAYAAGDQATIRLVAIVPVRCTMDVLDASIQGHQLVVQVHRNCNTSHELSVVGQNDGSLGSLSVTINGNTVGLGDYAALYQPEAYYDRVDQITVNSTSGNQDDLLRFAGTLAINLNPL